MIMMIFMIFEALLCDSLKRLLSPLRKLVKPGLAASSANFRKGDNNRLFNKLIVRLLSLYKLFML